MRRRTKLKGIYDVKDILKQKGLILEHVLYEMGMYLFTIQSKAINRIEINLYWECQLTHLRNLILFFSTNGGFPTDIRFSDVLNNISPLSISETEKKKVLTAISQSVSHITMARVKSNLTLSASEAASFMKKPMIDKIEEFVIALGSGINQKYVHELADPEILGIVCYIKDLVKSLK